MYKIFMALICAAMIFSGTGNMFALTAESINVHRDAKNGNLEIAVVNHTRQPRVDYIKKIEVVIDDQKPVEKIFFFQRGPAQKLTVPVKDIENIRSVVIRAYPGSGIPAEKSIRFENITLRK